MLMRAVGLRSRTTAVRARQLYHRAAGMVADRSLSQRASLNAVAAALDYAARLLVGLVVTPLLVAGLGDFVYGAWRVLDRMVGYVSPASGRPTQALKWTLAREQSSLDFAQKRRHVGSTLAVTVLFLPLLAVLGAYLVWSVPAWLQVQPGLEGSLRWATGLLVVNLALASLVDLPRAVLEGENLGYKRMGLSALLVVLGGGLTCLALYLNAGVVGVVAATLVTTAVTGVLFLQVVRAYAPWYGVERPSFGEVRGFLGLSAWFIAWNVIMRLMTASDLVVLGLLASVESVTTYTLTRYAPETLISLVAIMSFSAAPGLGGIIGAGDYLKAGRVRGEMMALTWLIATAFGCSVLVCNGSFVRLWVGPDYYAGAMPMLLIVLVSVQFVFIRNDANVIDLTLNLRRKVFVGALSVLLSLGLAGLLVGYSRMGIAGLCLGYLGGRVVLSVVYPVMVGRLLHLNLWAQLRAIARPAAVMVAMFAVAVAAGDALAGGDWWDTAGWAKFVLLAAVTGPAVLLVAFVAGLRGDLRRRILKRARSIVAPTERPRPGSGLEGR